MERNEVHAASHLCLLQPLDEFVSVNCQAIKIELNDVEMPCVLHMRGNMRADDFR